MAAPTTLGIDPIAVQSQATISSNAKSSGSTFDNILGTISYGSAIAGPVVSESLYASGNTEGASIVTAAVNASAGTTMGNPYSSSSLGLTTGMSSTTGATNYLTGGTSYSTTDTSGSGDVDSILSESYANQVYLLEVQTQMGALQTQTTSMSNAINVKDSMIKTVIQNFKV